MAMNENGCGACKDGVEPPFAFSMAFQPIVDLGAKEVFAYEALVRGPQGESAGTILNRVTPDNRYAFDQSCRVRAIELAARLGLPETGAGLSINFLPNAVYEPQSCIRMTLNVAGKLGFRHRNLIFEVTEGEKVQDHAHLARIFAEYKRLGFGTAIDDFGAGHSGLNLLSEFQPDFIKIDMALTRGIDANPVKHAIVESIVRVCKRLEITVIAEGIETDAEALTLSELGIRYLQGFLYAKPGFESLPTPVFP